MAQISNTKWMAFLVAAVAIVCFMNYQQATSTPVAEKHNCNNRQHQQQPAFDSSDEDSDSSDDRPVWDDGLSMLPQVAECGANEENHPGAHPSCEPTCNNPEPMCIKIFYTSMDYVPCFCKAPLVRNTLTKECVKRSECPPKTQKI